MTNAEDALDHPHAKLAMAALAPQLARAVVSVAADIALVIDNDGAITHAAASDSTLIEHTSQWLGRAWTDTVTGESRRKIERLLSEAQAQGVTKRREVNHPLLAAAEMAVAYTAVRLGPDGPVLAVGRDLRAVAAIQQRFVAATQAMERDYWAQRQAELQVRALFQLATDAVLVVDAHSLCILQANLAAHALFAQRQGGKLVGTPVSAGLQPAERIGFEGLLASSARSGKPVALHAHAMPAGLGSARPQPAPLEVTATPLRDGEKLQLMVQARPFETADEQPESLRRRTAFVEALPDALAITDSSGRVLMANPAFAALCGVADAAAVKRQAAAEMLGDPAHTLATAVAQARRSGLALVDQVFVGRDSARTQAVALQMTLQTDGDQECIGWHLRRIETGQPSGLQQVQPLTDALMRLDRRLGQAPLQLLLQEATLLAERHLIESAWQQTQGHADEAARLLGLTTHELRLRMQSLAMAPAGH